jgi:hypothetical protein
MSEDGGEVRPLFPAEGDDAAPVRSLPRPPYCGHRRFELDREARRVYCRDCGREVPAFEALELFSHEYDRWAQTRNRAEREARLAEARLEELARRERNAKARVRRAEGR